MVFSNFMQVDNFTSSLRANEINCFTATHSLVAHPPITTAAVIGSAFVVGLSQSVLILQAESREETVFISQWEKKNHGVARAKMLLYFKSAHLTISAWRVVYLVILHTPSCLFVRDCKLLPKVT